MMFKRLQNPDHHDSEKANPRAPPPSRSFSPWVVYGFPFGIMLLTILFTLVFVLRRGHAIDPVVSLSYGKYRGTPMSNGITSWLGMRYAAPPLGNLRFAAPVNPSNFNGIEAANKVGDACIGVGPNPPYGGSSEDCLFVNVYAPSKATTNSKLPVYVFIPGGGFNGDSAVLNASSLIQAAAYDVVSVTFTYRGGPFGFLASREVQSGASLNNGLKDQRLLLQWVQKNIAKFGGDPKHVTIGGASAGAGSVTQHLVAYGGRNDGLFQAALAESQSFGAVRTVAESQYQYDNLVKRAGCTGSKSTLACLRSLDIAKFQAADLNEPFPGAPANPLFPYNPTLDYDFITDYPINSFARGKFIRVPTVFGDDTNEGTIFTPQNINTIAASEAFLRDQFPVITSAQLAQYTNLYNLNSQAPAPYWHHVSSAYGETRYICPGIQLSNFLSAQNQPNVWNYRYNVLDPSQVAAGLNVPHTAELPAIWGPEHVGAPPSYLTTNKNIVPVMQGYWTSFIRSYDPNTYRAKGTPEWTKWVQGKENRIRLEANTSGMETVDAAQSNRCKYLASIAVSIKQ